MNNFFKKYKYAIIIIPVCISLIVGCYFGLNQKPNNENKKNVPPENLIEVDQLLFDDINFNGTMGEYLDSLDNVFITANVTKMPNKKGKIIDSRIIKKLIYGDKILKCKPMSFIFIYHNDLSEADPMGKEIKYNNETFYFSNLGIDFLNVKKGTKVLIKIEGLN